MNKNTILEINNIQKTYHTISGEITAIDNFSLKINKGEFISIIGTSGCGKSTILNILAGLEARYKGYFKLTEGVKIGYMLQEDSLFNWLTVFENAILGLKVHKELNGETIKKVNYLLDKYGLKDFKDKYPRNLSGGMRQRVALIRTLATDPEILLLDEPFSALDYQTGLQLSDDMYKIIKDENKTAIMVSHDIALAISLINII